MADKEALEVAEGYIKSQLRTLNDLPRELANTIANVYYKFALNFLEKSDNSGREFLVPESLKQKQGIDPRESFERFMVNQTKLSSDVEAARKFVEALRETDKAKQPNLYQASIDFILDCLKYNIEKPQKKSGVRRMIERKFKTVDEIRDLIDSMSFGESSKIIIDCPRCFQKLRIPSGRQLRVTCPKCETAFEVQG